MILLMNPQAASGQGRALRIWVPDGCLSRANFKRIRALATSMERGQGAPKLFQAYFYQVGEMRCRAPGFCKPQYQWVCQAGLLCSTEPGT
jgi:hypothetical protein